MSQRNSAKEKYWRRLLLQWRRSGLTGRGFCAERGVREANFYSWRREIARRDQAAVGRKRAPERSADQPVAPGPSARPAAPTFLKLTFDSDTTISPAIEVVVSERRLLRVRPGFDADLLRQLVRVLEEPSC